jgi:hypothetical protein
MQLVDVANQSQTAQSDGLVIDEPDDGLGGGKRGVICVDRRVDTRAYAPYLAVGDPADLLTEWDTGAC